MLKQEQLTTHFIDHYTTIMGARLRFWQAGDFGSPIMLLHGLNGCVENWRWNIGALSQRHRVFALDAPGHGLSEPDRRSFDLQFMGDLIAEFMRGQQLERANLVALSAGGIVAMRLALEKPQLLEKLVLVDAAGLGRGVHPRLRLLSMLPPPPPSIMNRRLRRREMQYWLTRAFFADPSALTEPMLDDFYTNISREHTMQTAATLMRWGVNLWGQKFVYARRLRHIKTPTLIIWGQQDRMIPTSHAYAAVEKIPDARLVIFDPCGHLPMLERPAEFNRVVLEFLEL